MLGYAFPVQFFTLDGLLMYEQYYVLFFSSILCLFL